MSAGGVVVVVGLSLMFISIIPSLGYDGYSSCSRPYRTSKSRLEPPCDFQRQSWCTVPGSAYPWHAVRRFVQENHGLMRRMYGDERHISVLRAEIESNDVEYLHDSEWKLGENVRTSFVNKIPTTSTKEQKASIPTDSPSTVSATTSITSNIGKNINTTHSVKYSTQYVPNSMGNSTHTFETLQFPTTPVPNGTLLTTSTDNFTDTTLEESVTDSTFMPKPSTEQTLTTTESLGATTLESTMDEISGTTYTEEKKETTKSQLFQDAQPKEKEQSTTMIKLRGVNACPVKEEVVAPFWANNTRGEVLALLNMYPFEQYVHWEKCTFELKQMYCREGCRCEQQYRLHRLLAYDPNNECRGIFSDWFKFPSCCVCRCYDLPVEFQITSRSPRTQTVLQNKQSPTHWYRVENDG